MSDVTQKIGAVLFFCFLLSPVFLMAGNGEEGAAFLEIPTGARSAALGGSYTALATNADAPVWNPAAMTYVLEPELSAQHLIYLQGTHYEYASFVWPASAPHYVGAAIQYFGSGAIPKTDVVGASIGDFSSSYAAYSLSYARRLIPSLSWGATGKMIHAQIDSVGATAAALDLALFSRVSSKLQLGLRMANMGTSLTFLEEGDPLPFGVYVGGAYRMNDRWLYTSELVYRRLGPMSWHLGAEWKPYSFFMVRSGFKTDALQQLSYLTGLSIGFGFSKWGHEIAYAWVPFGRLGHTHYFSLHLRLGKVIVRNDGERPQVLQPVESTEDWWLPKDSK